MSYRNDVDALAARHTALENELSLKTKELEQASRLLDEAKQRSKLPVLDNIRIASPCNADWAKMAGDERVRHCGDCKKNVYNLSEMTRDEAEALIVEKEGRLCMRYYQRTDGTILLKDCTIGVKRKRRRRLIVAGAAAAIAGGAAFAYAKTRMERVHEPMMGSIAMPENYEPVETQTAHDTKPEAPPHRIEVKMGGMAPHDFKAVMGSK